jgi:pre-mRNA-processing factor 17
MGHTKAVRDICFSNDGRRFLSCSYDKNINCWDTETGECLGSYTNGKIPYCIKFNPSNELQHVFLSGHSDKRIVQVGI